MFNWLFGKKETEEDIQTEKLVRHLHEKYGVDFETEYKNAVKRLTPQSISSFVKNVILSSGNDTEVIMLPAADKK